MVLIRDIVLESLITGYLSISAENQLRQLLKTKYDARNFRALMQLQYAASDGLIRQESREVAEFCNTATTESLEIFMKPELIDSKREIESHPIRILKANEPIPAPGKPNSEAKGVRPLSAVYRAAAILATTGAIALSFSQPTKASTLLGSRDSIEHLSSSSTSLSPKLARKFQRILDRAVEDGIPPGIALGISTPQGTWYGSSGIANIETGTAVQPRDRFLIGSITKTFTATTILKLAEEGKLNLNDTLGEWLPDIAANLPDSESITLRQLLNGQSGLYNFLNNPLIYEEVLENPLRDWLPEELVSYAYGKERSDSWVYPNTGFILGGMIAEKATGENFTRLMRDRVLDPLGLENTFFKEEETIPGGFVSGYTDFDGDGVLDTDVSDVNMSWGWAAGALVSNTQDVMRFSQALFGGELLSSSSFTEMSNFQSTGLPILNYGLGLYTRDYNIPGAGIAVGHGGDTLGHHSLMFHFPKDDITFVALQNSQPPNETNLMIPFLQALQDENTSVPEPGAIPGLFILGTGFLASRNSRKTKS